MMKNLLRLEELAQFLLCLGVLISADVPWWLYPLLLIGPDIGMLGYLVNARVGAITYNILHHKGVAVALTATAGAMQTYFPVLTVWEAWDEILFFTGIILFGHASLDRIFGYGLKFGDSFQHTHLGWIGKMKGKEQVEEQ